MEVYILLDNKLASIFYFWPFEAVEVVGGNMVKKNRILGLKKKLQDIYPNHGHFPATNGSKS